MEKTNVMRLLDQKKIEYKAYCYADTEAISGMEVAAALNENPEQVFKTLVAVAASKKYYVFMVPVCSELNLKKAAKAVGEKKIEMLKAKELLPLTGYVHGGCSPIGMKKKFKTIINDTALLFDKIYVSAGKVGMNLDINPNELAIFVDASFIDIVI